MSHAPAKSPCRSCPYRKDVPSGVWHTEEYAKLPLYDGTTGEQAEAGAVGAFYCHQQDGRLCAGWCGCHDMSQSLGLRMAVSYGHISDDEYDAALDYRSPVELWESGAAAAAHGMAEVHNPSERAGRMIDVLTRKRERRSGGESL